MMNERKKRRRYECILLWWIGMFIEDKRERVQIEVEIFGRVWSGYDCEVCEEWENEGRGKRQEVGVIVRRFIEER